MQAQAQTPASMAWERPFAELLRHADARVCPSSACTPRNLAGELARLEACGGRGAPRFRYAPAPGASGAASLAPLRDRLLAAAEALERADAGALGALYAGRARELALEAAICDAVGSARLRELARERFAADRAGDEIAAQWLAEPVAIADGPESVSDDAADPESLLSRLRQEVGRRRLPLQVRVLPQLAPLAATGRGTIFVAAGRRLRREDVSRTLLHELEGHALPGWRARAMPLAIFEVGTAGGSEDQEGYALALEESASLLGPARRRELSLRHLAATSVRGGADFADTVTLLRDHASLRDALRLAARAHRGGGLAREIAYLPAYLRVRASCPSSRAILSRGRVALAAAGRLAPFAPLGSSPASNEGRV